MNGRSLLRYMPPAGPILSLTLIGLLLLSALLYYRAIKIQRFLEPALALSQPRNEFAKNINAKFAKEFGTEPIKGVKVRSSSILIDKSLLFSENGELKASAQAELQKLSRILLSLMKDGHTRSNISLVLIIGRFPSYGSRGANAAEKMKMLRMVGFIQDALFHINPELGIQYSTYFAAALQPTHPNNTISDALEFRIIPSELLHIEVLEKLEKYAH